MQLTELLTWDSAMLFVRQGLLFVHLLGFAVIFAEILKEDLSMLTAVRLDPERIHHTAKLAALMLTFLWVTGIAMVVMDVGTDFGSLLQKPKVLTKIGVVMILTINGFLLHWVAFPMMTTPQRRPGISATICALLGAVSFTSWVYAAFVGRARIVAPKLSLPLFLDLYVLVLLGGVAAALVIVRPRLEQMMRSHTYRDRFAELAL